MARKGPVTPELRARFTEIHRKWYARNRDKANDSTRRWMREHPERVKRLWRVHNVLRRARDNWTQYNFDIFAPAPPTFIGAPRKLIKQIRGLKMPSRRAPRRRSA